MSRARTRQRRLQAAFGERWRAGRYLVASRKFIRAAKAAGKALNKLALAFRRFAVVVPRIRTKIRQVHQLHAKALDAAEQSMYVRALQLEKDGTL